MALKRGSLGKTEHMKPLRTGFTYTPRSELLGFELRPNLVCAMEERLNELEIYHRRPKDVDFEEI